MAPRSHSAASASTRARAASLAEPSSGLVPSAPQPALDDRSAVWAGWDAAVFERLAAMNPLSLGTADDQYVARRSGASGSELPVFSKAQIHPALLQALRVVDIVPHIPPRSGQVVSELSEENFSLLFDHPLPVLLRRKRVSVMTLAPSGRGTVRDRVWPDRSDIERLVPEAIFVSRQTVVTMRFVEWLDRRRRLRLNLLALRRDVVSSMIDAFLQSESLASDFDMGPEQVLSLAPSMYTLRLVSDRALDCFVPAYFASHMRMVRQIDGAGLRLDAEFKMAPKIGRYQSAESSGSGQKRRRRWQGHTCMLSCRGVRGLFLAAPRPVNSGETGEAYVDFVLPILRDRRESCEADAHAGRPVFFAFDNGPAYELFALAAAGEVWPQAMYGRDSPPCKTAALSRQHPSLRRDVIDVVSDPPHRRWSWKKALPHDHPDIRLFDECLGYALGRICAERSELVAGHVLSEPHLRSVPEADDIFRSLAGLSDVGAMKKVVATAAPAVLERMRTLLRCHDVRHHGVWKRVFQAVPPNMVLCLWAEACDVNPHFDLGFRAYAASEDFVSDIERIAAWFSQPRLSGKPRALKPQEDSAGGRSSRTSGPLLPADKRKEFLAMLEPVQLAALLRCGDVHRRFTHIGLRPPTGTTMVEQGFRALGLVLFEKTQSVVSLETFNRHAMLATLFLNFSVLRKYEMKFLDCADKKLLSLLDAAFERVHAAHGPGFKRGEEATRRFRACCAGLADADDAAPVSAREFDALLPLVQEEEED